MNDSGSRLIYIVGESVKGMGIERGVAGPLKLRGRRDKGYWHHLQ